MKKGTVVRILYPPYVAGFQGVVEARENNSERWLVRVTQENQSLLVSLLESDFEVLKTTD